MAGHALRTLVYVDGFNFYYGAIKGTPWKWLDPAALFCKVLGPGNRLVKVKYFTARVQPTPSDHDVHVRQAPATVPVWKNEEKGSDVNLALHLLNDAWIDAYDCAVVVSNDSDIIVA